MTTHKQMANMRGVIPAGRLFIARQRTVLAIALGCASATPECLMAVTAGYVTRSWQSGDGFPMNNVSAVAQTRDGYLWVGTRNSLARFDGVRFNVFDGSNSPNTGSPHVTSLFEAADGALWIGHEDGAVTRYRAGRFEVVQVHAAWRGGKIFAIGSDRAGDIWLMNKDGELARVKDGFVISAVSSNLTRLLGMANNPQGGFWIQRGNEVSVMEDGQLKLLPFTESTITPYIQGIGASRDGGLWVMMDAQILKWKDGHWTADLGLAPWTNAAVATVIETTDGHLIAGTADHGLYVISPGENALQFSRTNGFPSDWITAICQDREGNLWAGTGNGGLAMLRSKNLTVFTPPDQWQGRAVLSVTASSSGVLWIGTEGAGLYSYSSNNWMNFSAEAGIKHYYVWSVVEDTQGTIWAGTWGGNLFKQTGDHFDPAPGMDDFSAPTPALLVTSNGGLFVGSGIGLFNYKGGKVTWLARKPELISPDVRAIVEAPDGTLWFGMSGGGLGCLKAGQLRQFRCADGLSSDYVQCLHLEPDGTLWIGTFNGLNRLKDDRFTAITKRQGLPNDVICNLQDDGLGNFWISSHGGLARVNKSELNHCADRPGDQLHCLTYGLSDGLPSLECSGGFQPAGCKTSDGRLWFPTSKGLVAVDPQNVQTNLLPPPVIIERLLVDDEMVTESPALQQSLKIVPGQHRYEFQFTGLSFAAPEKVRFKYRLEGLETGWVEVQSPRRAYYSHIPPGNYRFQVLACNNDGVWNETGATLAFTALPAFWQTWWFRTFGGIMTAVAGGGIVWLDARRRMRRKLERVEHERAIERERARIAKDIHDDLGARLTRISLLTDSVPIEEVRPPQAAEALTRIFTTTHEITQAMDEIVWAINPQHDTLDSLAIYFGKFAQEFLEGTGVRCRLDIPMELPNWRVDAEVRHNLFLAYKESLNNVMRHARATEIRVSLATTATAFTLLVEDNGKGFVAGSPSADQFPGHNGLANMRQRLLPIGGRCEISSTVSIGTRVEFFVPRKSGSHEIL